MNANALCCDFLLLLVEHLKETVRSSFMKYMAYKLQSMGAPIFVIEYSSPISRKKESSSLS